MTIGGVILDIIALAIIILGVTVSAKRGFVRTLVEVVGFVAAILIAFTVSAPLANVTYDKMIEPSVTSTVEKTMKEGGEVAEELWDSFPGIIKNHSSDFGFSEGKFKLKVDALITDNAAESGEKISQNVIKPVVKHAISIAYSTVIAILLIIASRFLAVAVNRLFSFSLVGKINTVLGGLVGILRGVALAFVFCMLVNVVIIATKGGYGLFNEESINSSYVFGRIYGFSPFV